MLLRLLQESREGGLRVTCTSTALRLCGQLHQLFSAPPLCKLAGVGASSAPGGGGSTHLVPRGAVSHHTSAPARQPIRDAPGKTPEPRPNLRSFHSEPARAGRVTQGEGHRDTHPLPLWGWSHSHQSPQSSPRGLGAQGSRPPSADTRLPPLQPSSTSYVVSPTLLPPGGWREGAKSMGS